MNTQMKINSHHQESEKKRQDCGVLHSERKQLLVPEMSVGEICPIRACQLLDTKFCEWTAPNYSCTSERMKT